MDITVKNAVPLSDQKKVLDVLLRITITASLLLAVIWSRDGIGTGAIVILMMAGFSILLWYLNKFDFTRLSGTTFILVIVAGLTYLAIREDGFYNVPVIAYPIVVLLSGLVFGRRSVPFTTGLVFIVILLFWFLERAGVIQPFNGLVTYWVGDLITALVLLGTTGVLLWLLLALVENNLIKVVQSERLLEDTYALTLESWANALELRGLETSGHHQRLLALAERFGAELNLTEPEKQALFNGILLHDIGKMGIPDAVLLKPGKLTAEEFRIVKSHPQLGSRLLADIDYLQPALPVVLHHHERWDGKGYPYGLKAEEIPLLARIAALLDSWDALTQPQVYREAWRRRQALDYLVEEAGAHFDPELTRRFVDLLRAEGAK